MNIETITALQEIAAQIGDLGDAIIIASMFIAAGLILGGKP